MKLGRRGRPLLKLRWSRVLGRHGLVVWRGPQPRRCAEKQQPGTSSSSDPSRHRETLSDGMSSATGRVCTC